jgi:hypothetical protein
MCWKRRDVLRKKNDVLREGRTCWEQEKNVLTEKRRDMCRICFL